jgi:acyl transferase domain-containing protein
MATGTEIAIVGMAGRFPGASNVQKFWDVLRAGQEPIKSNDKSNGHEAIIDHTRAHWVKVNSLLPGVEFFDASFFGFSPREAETMDPQHRIFLECAWEAI